jgi:hypothetical protein
LVLPVPSVLRALRVLKAFLGTRDRRARQASPVRKDRRASPVQQVLKAPWVRKALKVLKASLVFKARPAQVCRSRRFLC